MKLAKYYKVSIDGISTKVSSLAQAKKLIQGQDDWEVSCFTKGDTMKTLQCTGFAWKKYYDLKRRHRWTNMTGSSDRLCMALYKSRIAK